MKDPMRNYKKIILGANRYSDSEESEPLLSSISSTSCSSFGSMFDARLQSESEEEHPFQTKLNIPEQNISSLSPLSVRKKFECQLIFGPNFRTPIVDMYDNKQLVLDHDDSFNKETHFIQKHRISIQSNTAKGSVSCGDFSYSNGFMDYKEPDKHTHNSLVTIFAIWNTTMGSSLLAMSWGIQLAGLFPGIVINILVAALCLYTCQLLLTVNEKHGMPGLDIEVSHLCKDLLGEWAEILANIFSIIVLLGADIVYMILMSNFLYNSVYFVHDVFVSQPNLMEENINVLCPTNLTMLLNLTNLEATHPTTMFDRVWDLYSTVPIILAVILFGVLNFKSPTFFTKFNSLGTISVLYLMVFVAVKAYGWGINVTDWWAELNIKPTFAALSGMLSLSYFIHNIIISIMRNNKNQEHNVTIKLNLNCNF
ncbi:hypothetical protein ABEB36_007698 [Hypothenemus hampei]|uniref:Amino acid transporter transmembrane domain-containing protein n=1 Tax=Hypothenemus hampei TaxID=57062 RepID=A0ABD1EXY0_HYPHA